MNPISIQSIRRFALWQPLTVRDFRLLWLGQGISLFGDQFYLVGLPWLALRITGSGLALGTVLMVAGGARAMFELVGGALSDRFSPRTLMLGSNVVRAIVTIAVTVVVVADVTKLWHLYILALIFGLVDGFFVPAYISVVPRLVTDELLPAGNALLRATSRFMALIGPAIAGLVISQQSLGLAFAIDAGTFVCATIAVWSMKPQRRMDTAAEAEHTGSLSLAGLKGLFASIAEGLRYAWSQPLIRALFFFVGAIEFSFVGPSSVGLAAMAKTRFEPEGAAALGWMLSAFGGGMLSGMLVAGSIKVARRRGLLVIGGASVLGLGLTLVGFASHVAWACVTLAFVGLGGGLGNILILALIQSKTEKHMLGRVMGLLLFSASVLEPLSFALAGLAADVNLTILFVAGGGIMLVVCFLSLISGVLRATD